jgi:CRISPR/Cas system-associated exonuclease Cas4 (RecB family)
MRKLTAENKRVLTESNWSYSKLDIYNTCQASFYERYINGKYITSENQFFGNALHEFLERKIKNEAVLAADIFEKHKVDQKEFKKFHDCCKDIKFFLKHEIFKKEGRLVPELEIVERIGDFNLKFKMDIFIEQEDKVLIYDLKSTKTSMYANDHVDQLKIYRYICQKKFGKEAETYLYYPVPDELLKLTFPLEDTFEVSLIDNIKKVINQDTEFVEQPHRFCAWCPFVDCCTKYQSGECKNV